MKLNDKLHSTTLRFTLLPSPSAIYHFLLISIVTALQGCAFFTPGPLTASLEKNCVLPADQTNTISGRWTNYPVPIAFFSGSFSGSETGAIIKAADTWNSFFQSSQGLQMVMNYGTSSSPTQSPIADPTTGGSTCSQGITTGTSYKGNVVLYKLSRWPQTYSATAIALTTFCTLPAKPYSKFYMAVIEFNYQTFFASGQRQPDLESIILHEFGHMIGLNHSCENVDRAGVPNCNNSSINPDYLTASMFPVFSFDQTGAGVVRNQLNSNDQGRANCIYQSSSASPTPTSSLAPAQAPKSSLTP
ncbi:hypothetical protein EBS43_02665 [bacterium]|jgi:hypothetical protein|nr:hypothetical protein [bacterium]